MSSRIHPRSVTAEQLYERPDDGLRHELLRGTVVSEPLPGGLHGRIVARLTVLLGNFVRAQGCGVVYTGDTGFVLARSPDTVRGPDIAFLSTERHRAIQDERRFIPGAPDLAIEVVSPHDRPGETLGKVADYLASGSRLVWVVNPAREEVSVFRTPFAPRILSGDEVLEGEDVLPGLSIRLPDIFDL